MTYFRKVNLPTDCRDIYACGDWHIGDVFYEPKAVERWLAYLNDHDPGVVFLMGDLGRYFPYSDRLNRMDETALTDWPSPAVQLQEVERIIQEIPEQHHIFLHHGNHENHWFREGGNQYHALAQRTGVDYVGYQAAVLLHWPGRYTRILSTHGHKSIPFSGSFDPQIQDRHRANARIAMRRMLTKIDRAASDMYFVAHTHKCDHAWPSRVIQMVNTGTRFVERENYIKEVTHPVWCYNTGSCTKSFPPSTTTYAEEAMYGPSDLEFVHVRLDDKDKKPDPAWYQKELVTLG